MVIDVFAGAPLTGNGYIAGEGAGIVTVAGAPAKKKITLMPAGGGRVIRSTVSAEDGTYLFDQIDQLRRYVVIAFDHTGQFNAVIRDNITPKAK